MSAPVDVLASLDDVRAWIDECGAQAGVDATLEKIDEARAAIAELIEAGKKAESALVAAYERHVDAEKIVLESINLLRPALARVGGGK